MGKTIKNLRYNKSLRIYAIINIIVIAALTCLFTIFQYELFKFARYLLLVEALFVIAWKDKNEKIIPNKYLLILLGIRVFFLICEWLAYPAYGLSIAISAVAGMAIGFLSFGTCYLVSRGGMGAGDVKLVSVLGFFVGNVVIMTVLILTVVSSAIYSLFKLARKKTTLKAEIPFAPFVLIGTVLAMMIGA